eukprot:407670-Pelagomonas_calceolata.AAC.3
MHAALLTGAAFSALFFSQHHSKQVAVQHHAPGTRASTGRARPPSEHQPGPRLLPSLPRQQLPAARMHTHQCLRWPLTARVQTARGPVVLLLPDGAAPAAPAAAAVVAVAAPAAPMPQPAGGPPSVPPPVPS